MGNNLLLQDACVLINLLATDRLEEIAHHLAYQFAIAWSVAAETIYLRRPADNSREQADLRTHVVSGLTRVLDVETELEQNRYLYYATELDDGEAMSLALAEGRRLEIATDDRKARRMVAAEGLSIKLWSTIDILKAWERIGSISPQEVKDTLTKISSRARFRPKGCAWWDKRLA
jgi:predicted nucleic acid-binding protein